MTAVRWRHAALADLGSLDAWRKEVGLSPIAPALVTAIEDYFSRQDFAFHRPGSPVCLKRSDIPVFRVLIRVRKSEPYSVFYIPQQEAAEILRIRHPRQKPLVK